VYDLTDGSLKLTWAAAQDTVAAVSMHSALPLVLSGSGHRRFDNEAFNSDNSAEGNQVVETGVNLGCNELAVWGMRTAAVEVAEQ
jgi:hypothetical protein